MPTIALVGCSHIHTPGFVDKLKARNDQFTVKYIWDPTHARALRCQEKLGQGQIIPDPSVIWADASISGVVICSDTTEHQRLAIAAAKAGKHMFVEKPLGMGKSDSLAMADAVEAAGVKFQTGYFVRGEPPVQFIKGEIARGAMGTITRARGSNCHQGALDDWFKVNKQDPAYDWNWMADPKRAGVGAFGDLATHALDLLLWLVGDIEAVSAQIRSVIHRYPNCDESGEALIRFKSGAIGTLAGGWVDIANPNFLEISGTLGHAAISGGKLYYTNASVPGADGKSPFDVPKSLAWPHAFELFLDALLGQPAPLVQVREAARRAIVMEAMYQAAAKNQWVTVD
jgi:predicted dehydrogenase